MSTYVWDFCEWQWRGTFISRCRVGAKDAEGKRWGWWLLQQRILGTPRAEKADAGKGEILCDLSVIH